MPPVPQRVRIAAAASLGAGLFFGITFVHFSLRARFTVPYADDWSLLSSRRQELITALFQPHNEHIMTVPRLLVWADFWIWGWPGYASYAAALLSHAAVIAVFLGVSRSSGYTPLENRLLIGWVLVTTCTTYALQGAVFPAAVNFPLVLGFGAVAMALVSCSPFTTSSTWWALAALPPALLAMFSVSNGLAVPIVLAGLSICLRRPRVVTAAFIGLVVLGAGTRYLLAGVPPSAFAGSFTAVAAFALSVLAGPLGSLSPRLAASVGAVIAVCGVLAGWRLLRSSSKTPIEALVAGSFAFAGVSAAMTAIGRAQFDPSVAAESRYWELASIAWACLPYLLIRPGSMAGRVVPTVAVVMPTLALVALPAQVFVGRVWATKADHLRIAGLTLTTEVRDDEWIWTLHPLGDTAIGPALPLLRDRDVAFLRFPERGETVPGEAAPSCEGEPVRAFESSATDGLRIQAWIDQHGRAIRIVDRESRARGLAWPAPPVSDPRATANDLVWAQVDILAGRVSPKGHWLGLSARGAGEPYTAQLLGEAGQVICMASVTCCSAPPAAGTRRELVIRGSVAGGYLDGADCSAVAGWAWDPRRPHSPIDVRISASNGNERVVSADVPRDDLAAAGIGGGAHGFHLPTESLRLESGEWQVSVVVAATGVELFGSPKTVICAQ